MQKESEASLRKLSEQLADAEFDNATLTDDKAALEASLASARGELQAVQAQADENMSLVKALRTEVEGLEESISTANKETGKKKSRISENENKIDAFETVIRDQDKRAKEAEAEIEETNDILTRNDEVVVRTRQTLAIAMKLLDAIEIEDEEDE